MKMNCADDENVCSVKKENNLGYYRLHTIWRKDSFFINVTSKNGAWRGEMTPNDVAKMSRQLEMEPELYLSLCKKALTCHDGQPGMVYAVEDGYFAWKRVEDEDSGIKVKMGSVMLEPTSFVDTIQNIVSAALNCNKSLQDKLKEMSEEKEKVLENRNDLRYKLNELIRTKETMENDLYSRFLLLINEKKKKIQELENLLEEEYKSRKSCKSRNYGNPYEVDTENDSEEEIRKKGGKKGKRKTDKSKEKTFSLPEESPEEKKLRNSDEDIFNDFERSDCVKGISPEPSTSKASEGNTKGTQEMSLKAATTKDELYDFFYGEL